MFRTNMFFLLYDAYKLVGYYEQEKIIAGKLSEAHFHSNKYDIFINLSLTAVSFINHQKF